MYSKLRDQIVKPGKWNVHVVSFKFKRSLFEPGGIGESIIKRTMTTELLLVMCLGKVETNQISRQVMNTESSLHREMDYLYFQ